MAKDMSERAGRGYCLWSLGDGRYAALESGVASGTCDLADSPQRLAAVAMRYGFSGPMERGGASNRPVEGTLDEGSADAGR